MVKATQLRVFTVNVLTILQLRSYGILKFQTAPTVSDDTHADQFKEKRKADDTGKQTQVAGHHAVL